MVLVRSSFCGAAMIEVASGLSPNPVFGAIILGH